MIQKNSEAKWQNELASHCQTLNLKDVTIKEKKMLKLHLYLFNVYLLHK